MKIDQFEDFKLNIVSKVFLMELKHVIVIQDSQNVVEVNEVICIQK